ncbi:MAG: redox-regulated ATPase YchF [Candidatus Aminicenantes bacterium]|nr:redox-regulated ATPase YchF [Candidatus Aminicenantes bacterium]
MKICIVGLPQSGKSSLFSALTGLGTESASAKGADPVAVVKVPDPRLEKLAALFEPKKKTAASIEFVELQGLAAGGPGKTSFSEQFLGKLRTADALLAVVRSFRDPAVPHPMESVDARRDLAAVETELLLSDLSIVESRIEKLVKQVAAKKSDRDVRELAALEKCRTVLESETPLRRAGLTADEEALLRGFRFLTQKPLIAVVNLDEDEIRREPEVLAPFSAWAAAVGLSAKIEGEIGQLSETDAAGFRSDFGIARSALDRLIATAYRMMGLISFFTVGSDEVKAWTVSDGTVATRAAGFIHSDIERGFIRAEVVSYDQFIARGDISACRTDGTLRLEGKSYPVRDGDIINFRFAV